MRRNFAKQRILTLVRWVVRAACQRQDFRLVRHLLLSAMTTFFPRGRQINLQIPAQYLRMQFLSTTMGIDNLCEGIFFGHTGKDNFRTGDGDSFKDNSSEDVFRALNCRTITTRCNSAGELRLILGDMRRNCLCNSLALLFRRARCWRVSKLARIVTWLLIQSLPWRSD